MKSRPAPAERFPDKGSWTDRRRAVCRRCHLIMGDAEPATVHGEFYHLAAPHQTRALACRNRGQCFSTDDFEIVPFLRKSRRRALARFGIRL